MLKFISFGSGSSGNCYYLATENEALIVDAGVGVRQLKKHYRDYGVSLSRIHQILITHDHADHIKSVGSLSHECQVPVYATALVHQGIERNYCVQRKVAPELKRVIEKDVTLELGGFRVTPFGVPHDSNDNVGYFIEAGGTDMCIITDAGEVTDTMKTFIGRAHHLVIEANHDLEMLMQGPYPQYLKVRIRSSMGHLSNTDCGQALAENMGEQLRHVWLCHLSEENNHPELARKTVDATLRSYGIIPGKDILLEVLKRKVPSEVYELV